VTNEYVLDASAIIALLKSEPGADFVADRLSSSIVSAVNLAEVSTKLADYGMDSCQSFDPSQAFKVGSMRAQTRLKGLSLGDRACLALAHATSRTALTADRAWVDLDVGVAIELIR
jgi:ribonuclease VapC